MAAISNSISMYKDLPARVILALVASHFIVIYGEDESVFRLWLNRDYYISVLASALIAFILISIVRWVNIRLDRRSDWKTNPIQRLFLQLLFALILPSLAAFFLAFLYFRAFGIDIFKTTYLKYDYTVIVLMITLLNAYYVCYYFYLQAQQAPISRETNPGNNESKTGPEVFTVHKGSITIPLSEEDICYFYRSGDNNYIRTFNGDTFIISQSLDEVQERLSPKRFFRANRQFLVNRAACKHYEALDFGKLQLILEPVTKQEIIVSQKRSKNFKEWLGA